MTFHKTFFHQNLYYPTLFRSVFGSKRPPRRLLQPSVELLLFRTICLNMKVKSNNLLKVIEQK